MRIALKDNSAIRLVKDYFPKGVHWYDDEGLQYIKTDPYGADLTFTSAGNLTEVFGEIAEGPGAQFMDWDRAVVAFIATLPADTDVLLYWH
jgi:hypothetical protein